MTQSTDGLVLRARNSLDSQYWTLPGNFEVIQQWMEDRGNKVGISGAGRIAIEMVRTLGGIRFAFLIEHVGFINFLNSLAHTAVESSENASHRRVRVGTTTQQYLIQMLKKFTDLSGRQNTAKEAAGHLRMLLDRSVFRVGLKLQCSLCFHRNWYAVDNPSEQLLCERCLQAFRFPACSPTDAKWEYRPVGPFATENFAQGSYGAILAIHFLLREHSGSLWCPGFEIKGDNRKTIECDFALLAPERIMSSEWAFAAGEAKCGDSRFKEKDYTACQLFSDSFPGSTVIFATTRGNLDAGETRAIRGLAKRLRTRPGRSKGSHIVVLTCNELAQSAPARSWPKEIEKEYQDDIKSSEMQRLARATQRLYLS